MLEYLRWIRKKIMQSEDIFIRKTFSKFLNSTLLALLGTTFSAFGNTLLAGNFLGKEVLSVMNILSSFTFLYAMFGCLISIGAASKASIAVGREDYKGAGEYEWLALVLSFVVPIVISVPCLIHFKGLFTLLGADEAAYAIGSGYGRLVIAFGFLNTLMYFPFNFLRLIGKGRYGMYSFGAMGIIDVVLVYIFLKLGMGAVGVALGYIISMLVANCAGLYFLFAKNEIFKIMRPHNSNIIVMIRYIVAFGGASGLNNLCKMLRTVTLNLLISKYLGKEGLQSLAVGCSIINLTSASVTGFGQAVSPIVGVMFGERDRKGQRQAVKVSVVQSLVFHTVLAVLIVAFAPALSKVFGITDADHIRRTAVLVRLVGISLIPASVMNIFIYYYTAIGENRCSRILTVMHAFVLVWLLTALHLMFDRSNMYGIAFIMAEILDFGMMVLLSVIRRKRNSNLQGILLEQKMYAEKFFYTVCDGTEDGAVETSKQVVEFCEENDVSPAICMKLPLVVEELLVVLARHCFDDNTSKIDVRISLVGAKVLMRLRCGGASFNPIDWYNERKATLSLEEFMEDESFGMKVVEKLVKDVRYTNLFDVNNLIVAMGSE